MKRVLSGNKETWKHKMSVLQTLQQFGTGLCIYCTVRKNVQNSYQGVMIKGG